MHAVDHRLRRIPSVQYLLRIGDTCLILAQRLGEWCGHAPIARGGHRDGEHRARPARPGARAADACRRSSTAAAPRRGPARVPARRARLLQRHARRAAERDAAGAATSRSPCCATSSSRRSSKLLWAAPRSVERRELAAIAGKAVKEARYHRAARRRLGRAPRRRHRRVEAAARGGARRGCGPTRPSCSSPTPSTTRPRRAGSARAGRRCATRGSPTSTDVFDEARIAPPPAPDASGFRSTGKSGRHSEHMGFLLAEMQHCSARIRAACGDGRRRTGRDDAHARARGPCSATSSIPRCRRCRSSTSASCATSSKRPTARSRSCSRRPTRAARRPRRSSRGASTAIDAAGLGPSRVEMRRAPAWTSDWISDDGRAQARATTASRRRAAAHRTMRRTVRRTRATAALRAPVAALPALRQRAHRAALGVRLDGLQVAASLPSRAANRSSTSSRSDRMPLHFHPLRVRAIEPDTPRR